MLVNKKCLQIHRFNFSEIAYQCLNTSVTMFFLSIRFFDFML